MKQTARRTGLGMAAALALTLVQAPVLAQAGSGEFIGRVVAEWLEPPAGDSRKMRLLEEFAYRDPSGKIWKVPKGAIVDGASIPAFLWTPVGSPYTGGYRRASVVHDYYCDKKTQPWKTVHRMFYDAMLAGGVPVLRSKTMYAAVYQFGPRWVTLSGSGLETGGEARVAYHADFTSSDPGSVADWVEKSDPSLEEIERHVDALEVREE
jgi:hypothetical protein